MVLSFRDCGLYADIFILAVSSSSCETGGGGDADRLAALKKESTTSSADSLVDAMVLNRWLISEQTPWL